MFTPIKSNAIRNPHAGEEKNNVVYLPKNTSSQESLEERVRLNSEISMPQALLERVKKEFKLPDYKKKQTLKTKNGSIDSMRLYTIQEASMLLGITPPTLNRYMHNLPQLVSYIVYEKKIFVPGYDLIRVWHMPKTSESYPLEGVVQTFKVDEDLIRELVDAHVLFRKGKGIDGRRLFSLYKGLSQDKNYGEFDQNMLPKLRRKGKPLESTKTKSPKTTKSLEIVADKGNAVRGLEHFFLNTRTNEYFCVFHSNEQEACLIYTSDNYVNKEIRLKFIDAFGLFRQNVDNKARVIHYGQDSDRWAIGGLFTEKVSALIEFFNTFHIWTHFDCRHPKRKIPESGIPKYAAASEYLRGMKQDKQSSYTQIRGTPFEKVLGSTSQLLERIIRL